MAVAPPSLARRLERWLWTGPVGHLIGGGLDLLGAYTRYLRHRAQRYVRARWRRKAPRR